MQETYSHRRLLMAALFFGICSFLMLTYNGRIFVNDELQTIDVTTSLSRFGDTLYDESLWYVWDIYEPVASDPSARYPLPDLPFEIGVNLATVPFYWLARFLPDVGTIHSIFLLNVVAVGAIGVLMFRYVLLLGYDERVAVAGALLLCTGTLLWPYSRTVLREPLMLFFVLLSAYALEQVRQRRYRYIVVTGMGLIGAVLMKEQSVFLLTALIWIIVPSRDEPRLGRLLDGLLVVVIVAAAVMAYTDIVARLIPEPISIIGSYQLQTDFFQVSFHTYVFSVGGSIWGTSPVLLLAIPGAFMLLRRGDRRYVWVMVFAVLGFAFAHAITTGRFWFGGPMWPSRFLIPVIPFMLIPALPVLDMVLHRPFRWWAGGAVLLLVVYGVWWQFSGASIWWYDLATVMPPEAAGLSEWNPALNSLRWLRPVLAVELLSTQSPAFAWVRVDVPEWSVLFGGITLLAAIVLFTARRIPPMIRPALLVLLPVLTIGVIIWGLRAIYHDPAYLGRDDVLYQIHEQIDALERENDVVLLNTPRYHEFFLNYGTFDHARLITLPQSPGEIAAPGEAVDISVANLPMLLEDDLPRLIQVLASGRERLWLLMDTSPFFERGLRPLERALTVYYYPIRTVNTEPVDPEVRLLEFDTTLAPDPVVQPAPAQITEIQFGDVLALDGLTMPAGDTYEPGAALPVTFHWRALAASAGRYQVAFFVTTPEGQVIVQGEDSLLRWGFLPSEWTTVLDNRAVRLPDDMVAGEYTLWLRLYTFDNAGQLQTLPVSSGETVLEDDIALLPVSITVSQ